VARRGSGHSYTLIWSEKLPPEPLLHVAEAKKALIERLFAAHRGALQAFFYRRIRHHADATDLAQEVYVRMLRVRDPDAIRDMEAYLFTVASNLAREHATREGRRGLTVDLEDGAALEELAESAPFDAQIDAALQVKRLREVLRQLPPRWHAAIVMQYVQGLSLQQIADRMGVSVSMVKKYLGKALGRCRRRMVRLG
jgi:RNA polymerase sigma factor (sigma-70 family)